MNVRVDTPPRRPRLPLGYQVMLGLGSLLAMLVAAVVLGVVLVMRLSSDESRLARQAVPYARSVATAALDAKGIANDERGFLLSGDPKFLREAHRRIAGARAAFDSAERAATGVSQVRAIDRARDGFEQWVRGVRAEFALYQRGDHTLATRVALGTGRELRKNYERLLADAQALGSTQISADASALTRAGSQSVTILAVALIAMLTVGGLIAFWLVRTIARPLYNLTTLLTARETPARS